MNLMLVDDEPKVLRGLSGVVKKECPDIEIVGQFEDGYTALEHLCELSPDVVITDIKMPKMTGLELAAEANELCPGIKFIILSGYADFEYAREALRFNVVDYFLKPPDLAKFLSRLKELSEQFPEQNPPTEAEPIKRRLIRDICEYIDTHYFEDISLRGISQMYFMNESYLSELFKKETCEGFKSYLTKIRLDHAKELLKHHDLKVYQISEMVGYGNAQYFFRVFKQACGVTPDEYRETITD